MKIGITKINFLFLMLLICGNITASENVLKNVLILHSYDPAYSWTNGINKAINREFEESGFSIITHTEFLDVQNLDENRQLDFIEFISQKYSEKKIELIIVADDAAFNLLLQVRDKLFKDIPIVFCGINNFNPSNYVSLTNVTGVSENVTVEDNLLLIKNILPDTKRIHALVDKSIVGQINLKIIRNALKNIQAGLDFSFSEIDTLSSIIPILNRLPANSVIIPGLRIKDDNGIAMPVQAGYSRLFNQVDRPFFALWDFQMGLGVVGGKVAYSEEQGKAAAGLALRILEGEPADNIPVIMESPNVFIFDYNILEKYNISSDLLPEGSLIINEPRNFYSENKLLFWSVVTAFIVLGAIIFILLFNIRLRKKAELALKESEQNYRLLFSNYPVGVLHYDINGKIVECNDNFVEIIGSSKNALIGLNMLTQLRDEKIKSAVRESLNGRMGKYEDLYTTITSNRETYVKAFFSPILDEHKNILGGIGIVEDFTERKNMENRLKESEDKFNSLFNNSLDCVYLHDFQGNILEANTSAQQLLGYSSEDIIKVSFNDFMEESELTKAFTLIGEIVQKGKHDNLDEFKLRHTDGSIRYIETMSTLVKREGEPYAVLGIARDVTEKKATIKALIESEAKFRQLAENIKEVFWLREKSTNQIVYINPGYETVWGRKTEELYNEPSTFFKSIHESDRERVKISQIKLHNDGIPFFEEFRVVKPDGTVIWVSSKAYPVRNADGEIIRFAGTAEDITEQKLFREKIANSEALTIALLNGIPHLAWMKDINNKYLQVNESFSKACGRDFKYIKGRGDHDLWRKDLADKYINDDNIVIKTKQSLRVEEDILIEGISKWHETYKSPVFDESKNVIGTVGIALDISERRAYQDSIRKLLAAVEQSPVSIVITNINGNIEFVNSKFTEVTGYSFLEAKGQNPRILKSGITPEEEYVKLWSTIISGKEWRGEFYNKRKDGTFFWESALISPILNNYKQITHFVAIKEDITQQKRIQKELIQAKEIAENSDKLKSEFLAQMSHEIRTPINTMLSFSGLVYEELKTDISTELHTSFNIIKNAGERIIRTIDLILNMSELQTNSYQAVFRRIEIYDEILAKLYGDFIHTAKNKNVKLILNPPDKDFYIYIDRYSVEQIFKNLIENAIKYTDSGKVEISIYENHENKVCVNVSDTGIGISEEYIKNLFQPFSQEEQGYTRKYEGNGLGLALVKKYCEINNADINVISQKNMGTTFTLTFNSQ